MNSRWHFPSAKSTTLIALVIIRITVGANAWRKVEEVMGDRRILRGPKGNVLSSCVTPAYMNALETMALTEKQQEKVQVCEKKTWYGYWWELRDLIRENG